MGGFDVILVKYGASMVGYTILGLPVFGPGSKEYLQQVKNDVPMITSDYMRNSSLLINLSKAIGRLVISYKEIQQLAGYTALVYDVRTVLKDLDKGSYVRTKVRDDDLNKLENQLLELKKGNVEIVPDYIQFIDMPIQTPNCDKLINAMNLLIKPGMNVVISGPNGCGKSSMFRILGRLWPIVGGTLKRPEVNKLFYIP